MRRPKKQAKKLDFSIGNLIAFGLGYLLMPPKIETVIKEEIKTITEILTETITTTVTEPTTQPPWHSVTRLNTDNGPGTFHDLLTDAGDIKTLIDDGTILQNEHGLVVPSGISGGSPTGFWKLGNQPLSEYPKNIIGNKISAIMHKPLHSGALAGGRWFGLMKEDNTAYLLIGLNGSQWAFSRFVNGSIQTTTHHTANSTNAWQLTAQWAPSGLLVKSTSQIHGLGDIYNGPGDFNDNTGAGFTATEAGSVAWDDWVTALGDMTDWFPYLWIDNYVDTDDPWAIDFAHI